MTTPPEPTQLVCMFHLNLAFSSLRSDRRAAVIERCYEPMLDLATSTRFPIGIEATGWTLERIAELDPDWIERARALIADGRIEFVGSAYAQCAAPLLPAVVNAWNLRLGLRTYERLLGVRPRVALVCEQAYAPGLVELYRDAGYEALIADWENAFRSHPSWDPHTRRLPQLAQGEGVSIPLIWSESIAFQKFQRFAHGELELDRYLDFVRSEARLGGTMMLYANDAEVFDHRPGRFAAEPEHEHAEWERIADALRALSEQGVGVPALPSDALTRLDAQGAGRELRLEAPDQPVPVKKQNKYNIGRWAVTGRDDVGINTRCWRLHERLLAAGLDDPEPWRVLCELWASDYRTHITDDRWATHASALAAAETFWGATLPEPRPGPPPIQDNEVIGVWREGTLLHVRCGVLSVALNLRRGLAVEAFRDSRVGPESLAGTIEHGYFPTIDLGADWYTGNLVQETPLRHKITDLGSVEPIVAPIDGGDAIRIWATLETELGLIEKVVTIDPSGSIEVETTLRWEEIPPGSLRVGHVCLNPDAFEAETLWYATHDGGRTLEVHRGLNDAFDHGAAVSALVSSRQGLGMTEGVLLFGDARRHVRIEVDQAVAQPLGLVNFQRVGDSFFLRASFSLAESDDTRRGGIPRAHNAPQRFRFRLSAESTGVPT